MIARVTRHVAAFAAAAALAGCSDEGVEMKNASVEEVAEGIRKEGMSDRFIDPGKWSQSVTLVSIDAPGMPEEVRSAMQQAVNQVQVHEVCLTPEEAKSPREDFFTGKDKNCRYEHFKWGGGKIDLKLKCDHPDAKQTMQLAGTYEPRAYTMTMTASSAGSGPEEQLVMKMRVDAKHMGACAPGEG